MMSLGDPWFWVYFIFFVGAVIGAFWIPGSIILRQITSDRFLRFSIGIPLGMALWAWSGYVFGYMGIRWASVLYVGFFFFLWVVHHAKDDLGVVLRHTHQRYTWEYLLIAVGVVMQMTVLWFTGVLVHGRAYFCCGNIEDNWWFASIAQELLNRFPPMQPGMEGAPLANYHYWSNLIVADLARTFHLPLIAVQFQYSGVLLSFLLGIGVLAFVRILKLPRTYGLWLLFFLYFGGDAVYWLLVLLGRPDVFSMSSLEDGVRFLSNLPRSYAVVLFFAGINLFTLWKKHRIDLAGILVAFVFASLFGMKIYLGIFALTGLGAVGLWYIRTRIWAPAFIFALTIILALVVYLPVNSSAGGLYFTGFWRFEDFIVQPALGLVRLELARTIFANAGNWIRAYGYDVLFFVLFTVSIFGSKLLGFFQTKKSMQLIPTDVHIFFLTGLSVSFIAGNFFQQTVGTSNTFNFLVSVFILGSIYTALACWYWQEQLPRRFRVLFVLMVALITLPRGVYEVQRNVRQIMHRDGYWFDTQFMAGFSAIDTLTRDTDVLLIDPTPWGFDRNSPTARFLVDRRLYYSGRALLKHFHADVDSRQQSVETVLTTKNDELLATMLYEMPVDYIVVSTPSAIGSTESAQFLETVYQNDLMALLKVSKLDIITYLAQFAKLPK